MTGLTLFTMFFGAGNLIFPPLMGASAGNRVWSAFLGFSITAVGVPVLGVAAAARVGGLERLAGRVHPKFALFFTTILYLAMGPCLTIPRTASISYSMAMEPFTDGRFQNWLLLAYSTIFFVIASAIAWKPEKLTDKLGKIIAPCLLILLLVITLKCVPGIKPEYGDAVIPYAENPFRCGMLDGYQTMDTIAALLFGIVMPLNIRAMGVKEEKNLIRETILAGLFAGVLMLVIYGLLVNAGAVEGSEGETCSSGARILSDLSERLYGGWGILILSVVFMLACLSTGAGLLCCCSEYFSGVFPRLSYRRWLLFFGGLSLCLANTDPGEISQVSEMVLNVFYPAAVVLILLSFLPGGMQEARALYPTAAGTAVLINLCYLLEKGGFSMGRICRFLHKIPFYEDGFGWIVGAAVSVLFCLLISVSPFRKSVVE
ncbi:MAG: branched-chain amino acid transport system II carrier protein [Candidatus Limivivens sp.]|nr:branched-chain amino acid transport system II carrier protein [Candidatus Limivivens sp.]